LLKKFYEPICYGAEITTSLSKNKRDKIAATRIVTVCAEAFLQKTRVDQFDL
jgi:hypothetical protein